MAKLNVNGKVREYQADPGTPLLWVLREQLGLTGTKYACGTYNRVRAAIKVVARDGDTKSAALSIQHADGSLT